MAALVSLHDKEGVLVAQALCNARCIVGAAIVKHVDAEFLDRDRERPVDAIHGRSQGRGVIVSND